MDKRLLLALALSAGVILLTQRLFPTAPQRSKVAAPDSSVLARSSAARVDTLSSPVDTLHGRSQASLGSRPIAPEETVTVRTAQTTYHLSTNGAAVLQVALQQYAALPGRNRSVELVRHDVPMFSYYIMTEHDSLSLKSVSFAVDTSGLRGQTPVLRFTGSEAGRLIALTYTFAPDSYLVRVHGDIGAASNALRSLVITVPDGIPSSEADTVDDQHHLAFSVKPKQAGATGIPFSKLDTLKPRVEEGPLEWVASKNKYFLIALLTLPSGAAFTSAQFEALPHVGKAVTRASASTALPVSPDGQFSFEFYAGPQELQRLLAVGQGLQDVNPYGGILRPVVQPLATLVMRFLLWLHGQIHISYGWVLVLFGIAVRLALWPLNQRAMRASLRVQVMQPEMQDLQKRYRNNPEKLQQEMFKLYERHGTTPWASMSGCLPVLIPTPVLFALFFVFQNTIEFRGVHFLWLPDISLMDPYYILPIIMGISMFLLSWISLRNSPPNPQAQTMAYVFPVVMTSLFLRFPSGLNLYYAVQNIAALPQQWLIARERSKGTLSAPARPASSPAAKARP